MLTKNKGENPPQYLIPFSGKIIANYIFLTYALSLVAIAGLCFDLFSPSYKVLEIGLIVVFGSWCAFSLATSDYTLVVSSIALTAAVLVFFGFLHYNNAVLFWVISAIIILYVIFYGKGIRGTSLLYQIGEIIFIVFFVITSGMALVYVFVPSEYAIIVESINYIPVLDMRAALTAAFLILAVISGLKTAFVETFTKSYKDFYEIGDIAVSIQGEGVIDYIKLPFVLIYEIIKWAGRHVVNFTIKIIMYIIMFFMQTGREVVVYIRSTIWNKRLWTDIGKAVITGIILGSAAQISIWVGSAIQRSNIYEAELLDLSLELMMPYGTIFGCYLLTFFLVGVLVMLWDRANRPWERAVPAGVMIFLCAWFSAITFLLANTVLGLNPLRFQTLGPFTAFGLVLFCIGMLWGMFTTSKAKRG